LSTKSYYIGLAATFHDPALAIVNPAGEVLFAESTERYMQDKRALNSPPDHFMRAPQLIKQYCEPDAELIVAISWRKRWLAALKIMVNMANFAARSKWFQTRFDDWSLEPLWPGPRMRHKWAGGVHALAQAGHNIMGSKLLSQQITLRYYDHHLTHAANACYSSPFSEGVCAIVDGYGEWRSCDFFRYQHGKISNLRNWFQQDSGLASLGLFYEIVCVLCGFDPFKGEEWKVMGLAAYGQHDPQIYNLLRPMLTVQGLGLKTKTSVFRANLKALQQFRRKPNSSPFEVVDLAHTGQQVFEEVMTELLQNLHQQKLSEQLMLGGGSALNSTWNGKITQQTGFKTVHIPSAPADDGNALGAALLAYHHDHPQQAAPQKITLPYLGSSISAERLDNLKKFSQIPQARCVGEAIYQQTAALLAQGKIIGWIQGRAEFGPRALGNRSILADPRDPDMPHKINARVKFRESFRPFAPAILHEFGDQYFENYQESPYMERTLKFKPEVWAKVPGVVHANKSGRLQTVKKEWSEKYYRLIKAFYELTDIPILLNTSFNIMGKPIAHSVEDAIGLFYTTGLDALVIDDYLIEK